MSRTALLLTALSLAAAFIAVASATSVRTPGCIASSLTGSFTRVPKSEGGGLVAYALKLTNTSRTPCRLGFAKLSLLDARGKRLPTTNTPQSTSDVTPTVVLQPGASATQTSQFSATYPGQGEPVTGPCEPVAHLVRIALGHARKPLETAVQPPTPVCSHGLLLVGAVTPSR